MDYQYSLLHLTDVHVLPEGPLFGSADTRAGLAAALDAAVASGRRFDAIVLSGDLTDAGDEPSYRAVAALVEAAAERLGARIVYAAGNHDERGALRAGLLGLDPSTEPYVHVVRIGGLRIITLDTSVPGRSHGELDAAQLAWLAAQLAEPAEHGTVLVLHHPPLAGLSPGFEDPRHGPLLDLHEPHRLAEVVRGTDVRLILAGHTHSAAAGQFAGIPLWVGPATSYAADPLAPADEVRGLPLQACTRVDITPEGFRAVLVPLRQEPAVYRMPVDKLVGLLSGDH
ncbi:metallophosphoesterase [Kitasatospora viridis]|uniref:3',5'-cyclic AMP phosphodiesterase CpdA n=1 Tax=Kitasatospora viridis TaxID=281105 RepID=A0A561T7E7_9ACTN|nr:metallophosphoesterase [Kitasatospora viridis]TWF83022.1 3',5'-cyclic AMP phosphodiesterase CpdA [Kitasatospora viridis]